ncbi:hypothetical protein CJI59_13940 [Streptomyces sp. Alain-F2R5]|nr:hypothetical protein [Streptomyces sp. Alain-F2R5]PAN01019.1 hypothetical protein CJI59_13940 [Streptomyces sp. Alain-F2R5]
MSNVPPRFGPTDPLPCDEDSTPFATVGIDLVMPREQLRAALVIGHAQMAGEPPLDEMSVSDIRREVEGYLGAASIVDIHRETAVITERITEEHAAELDAAIDRAYTTPPLPPIQQPRYGHGTVTLQTSDQGEITTPEPGWCVGHDDELVGYLADTAHNGPTLEAGVVTTVRGPATIMQAHLSHAPHLEIRPEPHPVLSVHLEFDGDLSPEDGRNLTRALRVAAARLDRAIADLAHLRGEQR